MEKDRQQAWDGLVGAVERAIESGKGVQLSGRPRMYAVLAADEWMRSLQEEVEGLRWALSRKDKYIESIQAEFWEDLTQLRAELAAAQETIADLRQSVERFEGYGLELITTDRGFVRADFTDSYGFACSLQESSNVDPHIWLGVGENRMHLTPEMVAALLPLLQRFAETGDLVER